MNVGLCTVGPMYFQILVSNFYCTKITAMCYLAKAKEEWKFNSILCFNFSVSGIKQLKSRTSMLSIEGLKVEVQLSL